MPNPFDTNKNSRIVSRVTENGMFRTETRGRDEGSDRFAISTNTTTNSTSLFIDLEGGEIRGGRSERLTGHQARTLYLMLQKHYG